IARPPPATTHEALPRTDDRARRQLLQPGQIVTALGIARGRARPVAPALRCLLVLGLRADAPLAGDVVADRLDGRRRPWIVSDQVSRVNPCRAEAGADRGVRIPRLAPPALRPSPAGGDVVVRGVQLERRARVHAPRRPDGSEDRGEAVDG